MKLPDPPLLLVTDRAIARRSLEDMVASAIAGGCRWVMVREKDMDPTERRDLVARLVEFARPEGALISVNGDLEAAAIGDGVHLPQGQSCAQARELLGPGKLIGVSAHDVGEAGAAASAGADYVTMSPVFPTNSKPGYGPPLTLDGPANVIGRIEVPVIALGGITAATAGLCRRSGAAGVAVMGTIMRASDPAAAIKDILDQWSGGVVEQG